MRFTQALLGRKRWRAACPAGLAAVGAVLMLASSPVPVMADEDARQAVFGIWGSSGTMIEVSPAGESLSAKIIALKNPNWREKDGVGVVGQPKTDLHNPDPALQSRSLIGLEMLSDYEFRRGKWQGRVYLPSNGTNWKSTARIHDGELLIRGFVGVSLLGKTQTFAPLSACNEDILQMIAVSGMTGTVCDRRVSESTAAAAGGQRGLSHP